MELARRTRWIAMSLPVALAGVVMLARPAPPGVLAATLTADRACGTTSAGVGSEVLAAGAPSAWYRLDATLDGSGTLVGQRLVVGRASAHWTAQLPPESFASGPVGGRVLVGDDDGNRSRLRVLDTVRGCWSAVGSVSAVIRSALLTPDGAVLEHRVDRATRRDLGVWQRMPGSLGIAAQVLPGLDPDPEIGPTFATTLLLADDGRLVVSACGERTCRTRVTDLASGATALVRGGGPAVGLAANQLVRLDACEGLPCGLRAVDLATRVERPVDDAMGPPAIAPGGSGVVVVPASDGLHLAKPGQAGSAPALGVTSLAPVGAASTADSGFEAPPGLVALAPDGRVADPAFVRLLDPATLRLTAAEVLP